MDILTPLEARRAELVNKLDTFYPQVHKSLENMRRLQVKRQSMSEFDATRLLPNDMMVALGQVYDDLVTHFERLEKTLRDAHDQWQRIEMRITITGFVDDLHTDIRELEDTLSDADSRFKQIETGIRVMGGEWLVSLKVPERPASMTALERLASLTTPVHRLPDELLAEIYRYVLVAWHGPFPGLAPFQYIASWVCSRWRSVAIDTARLWCDIHISLTSNQPVELLKVQIERSKACPLNVNITSGNNLAHARYRTNWHDLMTIIACVDRWESFGLSADADYLTTIVPLLHNACAPRLNRLVLRFNTHPYLKPLFTGGTPNLSYVVFGLTSIASNLTLLRGLTSLTLYDIPRSGWATYAEFQRLLAACPLTYLSISGRCFKSGSITDRHSSTCLPLLSSLEFSYSNPRDDFTSDLFNAFSAPGLRHLIFDDCGLATFNAFVRVMRASPPSSRFPIMSTLDIIIGVLVDDTLQDDTPLALLPLFPQIKKLTVCMGNEDLEAFLLVLIMRPIDESGNDAEPVCPQLRTLNVDAIRQEDVVAIQDFIVARAAMGFPLATLSVDDSYWNLSSAAQAWFSTHVEVVDEWAS